MTDLETKIHRDMLETLISCGVILGKSWFETEEEYIKYLNIIGKGE